MGATKHEKTFVDYNKPYETNIIGLRGIIYFAAGLVILIVVTFGLMLVLLNLVEDNADAKDRQNVNPMTENIKESERLPPEPRLQAAPGFGVDSPNGRVNLELSAPQGEYNELHKIWEKELNEGQKDAKTGTVISLPIEEAKKKVLEQNLKANAGGKENFDKSRLYYSEASAGRLETGKRK